MIDIVGDTLEMLRYIASENSEVELKELLTNFGDDYRQRVDILINSGYVIKACIDYSDERFKLASVKITAHGKDFLASLQQKAVDASKKEMEEYDRLQEDRKRVNLWNRRNARRQWAVAIIGLVFSLAIFIIGILVSNNAPIRQWILSIFK